MSDAAADHAESRIAAFTRSGIFRSAECAVPEEEEGGGCQRDVEHAGKRGEKGMRGEGKGRTTFHRARLNAITNGDERPVWSSLVSPPLSEGTRRPAQSIPQT